MVMQRTLSAKISGFSEPDTGTRKAFRLPRYRIGVRGASAGILFDSRLSPLSLARVTRSAVKPPVFI